MDEMTEEQRKQLRKDIESGLVMIVEVEHYKRLAKQIKDLETLVKEWREKAEAGVLQVVTDGIKLQLEAAKRVKELEDKIDIAITSIQTAQNHACPLCKDYLNEAEQALKG